MTHFSWFIYHASIIFSIIQLQLVLICAFTKQIVENTSGFFPISTYISLGPFKVYFSIHVFLDHPAFSIPFVRHFY